MLRKFVTDITPSAPDPGPAPIFGRVIRLHDLDLTACRWRLPLGDVLIHNGRRLVFPKDRRLQLLFAGVGHRPLGALRVPRRTCRT